MIAVLKSSLFLSQLQFNIVLCRRFLKQSCGKSAFFLDRQCIQISSVLNLPEYRLQYRTDFPRRPPQPEQYLFKNMGQSPQFNPQRENN